MGTVLAVPWGERNATGAWPQLNSALRKAARAGTMLPFMLLYDGDVGRPGERVERGARRAALAARSATGSTARSPGAGIVPTAVAMLIDHCFTEVGLHRVEIDIRPENGASLRVVDKLGLRREGFYERYLDIDGAWRDHVAFAMTVEELGGSTMLSRLPALPALDVLSDRVSRAAARHAARLTGTLNSHGYVESTL